MFLYFRDRQLLIFNLYILFSNQVINNVCLFSRSTAIDFQIMLYIMLCINYVYLFSWSTVIGFQIKWQLLFSNHVY